MKLGDTVRSVEWEVIPDKYAAPRRFDNHAAAERYGSGMPAIVLFRVAFDTGTASAPEESPVSLGELIGPGDSVRRVEYGILPWRGHEGPTRFDDLEAAKAAVPAGRVAEIHQRLWVGPHRVRMTADSGVVVDKSQKES